VHTSDRHGPPSFASSIDFSCANQGRPDIRYGEEDRTREDRNPTARVTLAESKGNRLKEIRGFPFARAHLSSSLPPPSLDFSFSFRPSPLTLHPMAIQRQIVFMVHPMGNLRFSIDIPSFFRAVARGVSETLESVRKFCLLP